MNSLILAGTAPPAVTLLVAHATFAYGIRQAVKGHPNPTALRVALWAAAGILALLYTPQMLNAGGNDPKTIAYAAATGAALAVAIGGATAPTTQ